MDLENVRLSWGCGLEFGASLSHDGHRIGEKAFMHWFFFRVSKLDRDMF